MIMETLVISPDFTIEIFTKFESIIMNLQRI